MPVLVNSETGDAEDLPKDQADISLATGTHQIPLIDQQGNSVMSSLDQAPSLLQQGYSQPSTDQLQDYLKQTKYGTTTETAKALGEEALRSGTFGLSNAVERGLGAKPEDIRNRQEILEQQHPYLKMGAGLAGLTGSAFIPGVGEANLLGKAGQAAEAGAQALGLARVGSAAARMAAETALFQTGEEAAKMFVSDPNQSAETAITDVAKAGLGGALLGGAFGAVSPLWSAASETRLGQMLSAIKDRANGVIKNAPTPEIEQMIEKSGIQVPAGVRAALGDSPDVRNMFNMLQESSTGAGKDAQEALSEFKTQANQQLLNGLNRTPDQVNALADSFSEADAGAELKQKLTDEIKSVISPLAEQFNKVKEKFSTTTFSDVDQAALANSLSEVGQKYAVSPSSSEFQKINGIIKELPNIKTLEDLRNFQSVHMGDIANKQLWPINGAVRDVMRNAEESVLMRELAGEGPELQALHQTARAQYREAMETMDALNDRLHVGRYSGPDTFLHALNDMKPEDVLRRLTPKNDSGLLDLMSSKFPQTTQSVRENYINQALISANKRAPYGEVINSNSLFGMLDKWSPELKQFAIPDQAKVHAIRGLLDAVPTYKSSGTAKNIDSLWSQVPAGIGGVLGAISGHGLTAGIGGALVGMVGKLVARDAPDAIKWSILKYLGDGQPINSKGYKAMVDFTSSMINGENNLNRAVKDIFKKGAVMAPSKYIESDSKKKKIDNKLKDLQSNNAGMLNIVGEHQGYYLPQHTSALSASLMRGVNYLNAMRPKPQKLGPLDPELPPSEMDVRKYGKIMDVVNQPLVALDNIKNGTITTDEVQALQTVYPALYQRMSHKIMNELTEYVSKGNSVPYTQRLNLSLFLGEPLDSTMTPQAIIATQPLPASPMPQGSNKKGSMKNINKLSQMAQSPTEARQMHRIEKS